MQTAPHAGSQGSANTKTTTSKPVIELALLLAGSLLVGFSMGRWLAPLAAWIGPVLVLRYARDHKVGRGYLLVLAAYILAVFIAFGQFFAPPIGIFIVVGNGLLMSLPYLADRLISPRLKGFSSTFVFPLAATTLEFLYIHTNPLGTWGTTGFTQYGNLPIMQFASVTGMIGITFLMGWFAAIANWAWEKRERGTEVLRGFAVFGAVMGIVFIFGYARLNLTPTSKTDETIRVAGISAQPLGTMLERVTEMLGPDPDMASPEFRKEVQSHWDAYFDETVREAQAGARVIVWPELHGFTLPTDEASYIAQAQEIAHQNGIYLAIPLGIFDPELQQMTENKLLLIDPTGAIVMEHFKYGGAIMETTLVGDGILQTVATSFGVLSGVICYDMDYPSVIQQSGKNATGLMLVPSSDWFAIDPIHSQMAVFRAIENGMSLVRQTNNGLSIAVDPYGRVLAQTDFFGATDRTMVAQVPVKHVTTVYTLFGRWFEWLCLAGFLFIVGWALFARRDAKT